MGLLTNGGNHSECLKKGFKDQNESHSGAKVSQERIKD
ncbi:hypothetical protein BSG1_15925 [Bacillus sp. SG-1]|nr:hypothetical protein BSG1_15925 [Bacillus sp. SG-1]